MMKSERGDKERDKLVKDSKKGKLMKLLNKEKKSSNIKKV